MAELVRIFVDNLLPILLIASAGFAVGKLTRVESRPLGRLTFYVFSPMLIFRLLIDSRVEPERIGQMLGFAVSVMLAMGGLAYLVGRLLRLPRTVLVALVLTVFATNNGNYGMPLVSFAFGMQALAYASVYYAIIATLTNTVGVLWVSLGHMNFRQAVLGLFKVPMLYALAVALVFLRTGWTIPTPLDRSISILAGAAVPCMLILLGLELSRFSRSRRVAALTAGVILRLLVAPLVGSGLASAFGLEGAARQAGVTQASMPTAVLTTVLATEYDLEPQLVTAIVFFSTVLSPLTLTPLLFLLGR